MKGETTAIQLHTHPSQQKVFTLLGMQKLHAPRERILSHIASRIQLSLRIGWMEVQPTEGTLVGGPLWKTILYLS